MIIKCTECNRLFDYDLKDGEVILGWVCINGLAHKPSRIDRYMHKEVVT